MKNDSVAKRAGASPPPSSRQGLRQPTRAPYEAQQPLTLAAHPLRSGRTMYVSRRRKNNASVDPVLPLVASTIVVRPGSILPALAAASVIETAGSCP